MAQVRLFSDWHFQLNVSLFFWLNFQMKKKYFPENIQKYNNKQIKTNQINLHQLLKLK